MWCDAFVFVNRTLQIFTFYQTLMTRSAVPALNALIFFYIFNNLSHQILKGYSFYCSPFIFFKAKLSTQCKKNPDSQPVSSITGELLTLHRMANVHCFSAWTRRVRDSKPDS